VARYGRSVPHQPILPKLDTFRVGAVAPFQSTVILAGSKGGVIGKQRKTNQPVCGPYFNLIERPGVPTPNYTGTITLAENKTDRRGQRTRVTVAPAVIGAPVPLVSVPRYMGLFVRPIARPRTKYSHRNTKFRFTPMGGFVGAKLGFLTLQPTRSAVNFMVQPTREGSLLAQ
jgi:hypothetical protein